MIKIGDPEETPQELADKLRASRAQMYGLAKQLRDLGFEITIRGTPSYTSLFASIPVVVEKTTTTITKESL